MGIPIARAPGVLAGSILKGGVSDGCRPPSRSARFDQTPRHISAIVWGSAKREWYRSHAELPTGWTEPGRRGDAHQP